MQHINIWETKNSDLITYVNTIEEVIKYIKENKRTSFSVISEDGLQDGVITTVFIETLNKKANDQNIAINYVDDNHPFFYDNLDNIYFSKDFFYKNKDIILSTIEEQMIGKQYVNISKYAYSDDLIKKLCSTVTSIYFDDEIQISDEIKDILKKNHINAYTYKNGKRIQISTNQILGQDYKDVISEGDDIKIRSDITDLYNLKYIPENKVIHIYSENDEKLLEDYDNFYNIISKIKENGQKNKIIIKIKNRNKFSKSKLYNSNFDFMIEGLDVEPYKLEELKKEDELLNLMVADIKDSNYSLFEKYIAAYNIVKKFKKYLENKDDKTQSRNIRKILNNDYMVCVGYTNLLQELLERLEIPTYKYNVSADISYDNDFTTEEKTVELVGHARIILNINDPKYGIKGFYVADPTWDNDLENDYYNHALMTFDKTSKEKRMFRLSNEDLIMNVKSMEEFSYKVNLLLNHLKLNSFNKTLSEKQKETNAIISLINSISNILISLLPEKYLELKKQYPEVFKLNADNKNINDFLTIISEIFINNLGKDISIDTVIKAAGVVNKDVFGFTENEAIDYEKQLLENNLKMDKIAFPYYYDNHIIK